VRLRFQADEDLNETIVFAIRRREPGLDFQTALQAGLKSLKDSQVLALAAQANRILVTHDKRTMPRHFAEFIQTATSPGVLLVPQQLPVSMVVEEIILLWAATEPSEWTNRIVWLPL
jgi:predicted nuclease of predicted toxin-antitoxin system